MQSGLWISHRGKPNKIYLSLLDGQKTHIEDTAEDLVRMWKETDVCAPAEEAWHALQRLGGVLRHPHGGERVPVVSDDQD